MSDNVDLSREESDGNAHGDAADDDNDDAKDDAGSGIARNVKEDNGIVVIGTTEFLPGFALAGIRKTVLASREDVKERLARYRDAGIIVLDERLASVLPAQERELLETSTKPIVITLGKTDDGYTQRLKAVIRQTVGVDLLR